MRSLCLALSLLAASPALAEAPYPREVDVELVLAVDVSRSMSPRELEIQRRGYAEAIRSDEVHDAITGGLIGEIALTYVEWAGDFATRVVLDWTIIATREDADAFATKLTHHFNTSMRRTSISGGIDFALDHFEANDVTGLRRVIDVSGDGPNNQGAPVTTARDRAVAAGAVINGLPLMTQDGMFGRWDIEDLDLYYANCVVGGPGSFVIPVLSWRDFPDAVRRKMVLEIAGVPRPELPERAQIHRAQAYDCLVGEKMWQRFRNGMQP